MFTPTTGGVSGFRCRYSWCQQHRLCSPDFGPPLVSRGSYENTYHLSKPLVSRVFFIDVIIRCLLVGSKAIGGHIAVCRIRMTAKLASCCSSAREELVQRGGRMALYRASAQQPTVTLSSEFSIDEHCHRDARDLWKP